MSPSDQEDMSLLLDSLTTKMSSNVSHLNWTRMPVVLSITPEPYVAVRLAGTAPRFVCCVFLIVPSDSGTFRVPHRYVKWTVYLWSKTNHAF